MAGEYRFHRAWRGVCGQVHRNRWAGAAAHYVSGSGARLGLPQAWVRQVFFGQIEANKMVQRGLIARWRFDPAAAPVSSPDLTAVRPLIDRVNDEILQQLAQRRADLTGPGCATRVSASVFTVFADGRADALHQAALVRAAAALCSA